MVSVSIEDGRTKRRYEGDFGLVAVIDEKAGNCRVEQTPSGWQFGTGSFFVAAKILQDIAEQEGDERFRQAARDALAVIERYRPE